MAERTAQTELLDAISDEVGRAWPHIQGSSDSDAWDTLGQYGDALMAMRSRALGRTPTRGNLGPSLTGQSRPFLTQGAETDVRQTIYT